MVGAGLLRLLGEKGGQVQTFCLVGIGKGEMERGRRYRARASTGDRHGAVAPEGGRGGASVEGGSHDWSELVRNTRRHDQRQGR